MGSCCQLAEKSLYSRELLELQLVVNQCADKLHGELCAAVSNLACCMLAMVYHVSCQYISLRKWARNYTKHSDSKHTYVAQDTVMNDMLLLTVMLIEITAPTPFEQLAPTCVWPVYTHCHQRFQVRHLCHGD